ncbi:MAG: glycoside hydrolase family 3 protein, partial [Treponema sp.]|nr:glycoside hydrolase family 3 protein [Treponema sp.]
MNKNVVIVFVFILFFFSSCTKDLLSEKEKNNRKFALEIYKEVKTIQKENDEKFENYLSNLSLEEKVSQLFIINLEGNKTFRAIDVLDGKPYVPGGYLFFSYNLSETFEEVKSFTDDIKNYCVKNNIIPPFLAVDEEGGYVQRLRKLAGKIPSEEEVAETMTVAEAYELYSFHAEKMREMGFHINLAPVSEVLSDYNKDFLDNRSFGDAVKTEQYSIAALNAYQNNGISCVIKH